MADSQSREVYFLKQVANQKYPEDFAQNLVTVNQTLTAVSKYLISMQTGIDDLNRDILEVVQDFINEIIILFGGGAGGDSGFELGDLKYIFRALGELFGFGSIGPDWNALEIAQNFFDNFIQGLINIGNSIEDWFQGVMSGIPWFTGGSFATVLTNIRQNAVDALVGWINPSRIPFLPIGHIGQSNPNLLLNGNFNTAVSLDGEGVWTWDGTVGHSSLGSARTTGTGVRKVLTSNPVAVSAGQELTISGRVRWASAAGTGPTMKLQVVPYIGTVAQAAIDIANVSSPGANSGSFNALSGTHTVAASVTEVRVKVTVEAALTAGTVWWDDLSLTKPAQTLPQSWIQNLVGDLFDIDGLASSAFTALEQIGEILIGAIVTPVTGAVQRFKDWFLDLVGFRANTTDNINAVKAKTESVSAAAVTTVMLGQYTVTRTVYSGNGTWTKPTPPAGKRIAKIAAACINGGGGGGRAVGYDNGDGGLGGGYQFNEWTNPDDVPGSVAITIGPGGASSGTSQSTSGGISRFGTLLQGISDTSSIPTPQGALFSSCAPGNGGDGGYCKVVGDAFAFGPSTRGGSSAKATGGSRGTDGWGKNGGNASSPISDPMLFSGGGGGGGGYGAQSGAAGNGGNPSAPGGGGGAGGSNAQLMTGSPGSGRAGANGGVAVWVYMEDIPA